MRKFLIILLVLCFAFTGCGNNDNNSNNQYENNNYTTTRTTINNNTNDFNNNDNNIKSNITPNTETEISSFSTKIYTPDDEARQTNIKITCSKLNGTIVKPRRNFFFL